MNGNGDLGAAREQWRTRAGFIFATIGSAAGLGNIWRFSFVAGENGGATFLLVYLVCVVLIGAPILIAELAIGRSSRGDAVAAFQTLAPASPWFAVGGLGVVAAFFILGYYGVIAGWALKYFVGALTGALWSLAGSDYGGYFSAFIANPFEPVLWQLVMMAATVFVIAGGVQRGIELVNKTLIPILGVIVVGLAVFSVSLEGAERGLTFLLAPDWSVLKSPDVYLAATGQAFFSLGVGMAIFITYGSYLSRQQSIPAATGVIVVGDTLFAVIAGVAIFPAVFAFGLNPAAGPKLAFITLPQLFLVMPGGGAIGPLFFFLLTAAALTSMVSILEVPVAYAMRRWGMGRRTAAVGIGAVIFIVGIPAALGYGVLDGITLGGRAILDAMDYLVANLTLPVGGFLIAAFAGWRWTAAEALSASDLGEGLLGRTWLALLRYAVPVLITLVLSDVSAFGTN
jgi:neurotransmitter:Na+ symporter, NSS family